MKVSSLVRRCAEDRGWHILSVAQPQHLFPDDGRRLKRCSIPTDPWQVHLGDQANYLESETVRSAVGATADAAVLAAIPSDLRAALRRLEEEVEALIVTIR